MIKASFNRHQSRIGRLSRPARRLIAVISLAGLPCMYAWSAFWLSTSVAKIVWGPVSFLLIGATAAGSLVLYRFVRNRADLRANLDERQRQLRDRAMVLSYQVLSGVVVAALLGLGVVVLGLGRRVILDPSLVGGLAISAGVLMPLLPIAALAWIEPETPPEA